ncbi:hypothetical protein RUM43_010611 [Polyplax serrata]|uniref:Uncharacterized protein n=1 Tax=Polyplax serrata TaxID=468196 RepID=A0AAN8PL35_POLSC
MDRGRRRGQGTEEKRVVFRVTPTLSLRKERGTISVGQGRAGKTEGNRFVTAHESSTHDGTRRGASKGSAETGKERGNVPKPPCRRGGGPLGRPRRGTHRSPRGSAPGEGDTLESASDRVQG